MKVAIAGLVCAAALSLAGGPTLAASRIDGYVVDCHGDGIANYAVTLTGSGISPWTNHTYTNGYFFFIPDYPGYYYITVNGTTGGPFWFAGIPSGIDTHTGNWRVCNQSQCRPPCEISDPESGGPTRASQKGDDDMPDISPGDDDTPDAVPGGGTSSAGARRDVGGPVGLAIHGAAPNPFRQNLRVSLRIDQQGKLVSTRIFDVRGRQVKAFPETYMPVGQHDLTWDGRSDAGARVPPGVYFVRVAAGAGASSTIRIAFMP